MATVEQVAAAFAAGGNTKCGNASTDGSTGTYTLHKTVIARKQAGGGLALNWGGFYTPTTASHMNAVLKAMGYKDRVSYAQARDRRDTVVLFA